MHWWTEVCVLMDRNAAPGSQTQEGSQKSGAWWSFSRMGDAISLGCGGVERKWDSTAQGGVSSMYILHVQWHLDEYWTSSQNFVLFWMISETTEKPPCNLLSPQSTQEMIFYFKISKNHGTQGDPTNCINILGENLPLLFWFMSFGPRLVSTLS